MLHLILNIQKPHQYVGYTFHVPSKEGFEYKFYLQKAIKKLQEININDTT